MPASTTSPKKKSPKKQRSYPKIRRKLTHSYTQYHTNVGAFGKLVIPALERHKRTIEYTSSEIGMRKPQFDAMLRGTMKTLVLSVEQAVKLANFLELDPVHVIEAYLWDATRIKLAPVVAHTYTDLYTIFQWYRAHLGQEVPREGEDRQVLEDLSAVLYLYEVYRKVKGDDQVYLAFRKTLNAFVETMDVQVPDEVVLGL